MNFIIDHNDTNLADDDSNSLNIVIPDNNCTNYNKYNLSQRK
jgi:hypothetical protein